MKLLHETPILVYNKLFDILKKVSLRRTEENEKRRTA